MVVNSFDADTLIRLCRKIRKDKSSFVIKQNSY